MEYVLPISPLTTLSVFTGWSFALQFVVKDEAQLHSWTVAHLDILLGNQVQILTGSQLPVTCTHLETSIVISIIALH